MYHIIFSLQTRNLHQVEDPAIKIWLVEVIGDLAPSQTPCVEAHTKREGWPHVSTASKKGQSLDRNLSGEEVVLMPSETSTCSYTIVYIIIIISHNACKYSEQILTVIT